MSHYCIWDSFWNDKFEGLILNRDLAVDEETEDNEISIPQETDFYCRTCEIQLNSRPDQVAHYKSDEHRRRIKSKLRSKNESDTDSSGDDSDEADDDSDWSGDENIATSANLDSAKEAWRGRPRQEVHFFNEKKEKITIFRAMVAGRSETLNEFDILTRLTKTRAEFTHKVDGDRYDAVLLFAAGAFAGCIFVNGEPAVHRVIKKYVIRAKRGTAQSTRDNKNATKPSSMGAQLRRQNEKVLLEKISAQIMDWSGDLEKCKTIFIRAPKHQKSTILQPLHSFVKDRTRIRPCPCPMHRPRFQETTRMFQKIFSVKLSKTDEPKEAHKSPKKPEVNKANKPEIISKSEVKPINAENESDDIHSATDDVELEDISQSTQHLKIHESTKKPRKRANPKRPKVQNSVPGSQDKNSEENLKIIVDELFTAVKANSAAGLDLILQRIKSDNIFQLDTVLNSPLNSTTKTLLHIAAEEGHVNSIIVLLANGSDPSKKTTDGTPPFRLCSDRDVRAAFWNFRSGAPDMYNWAKAEVPDPATIKENPTSRNRPKRKKKPVQKATPAAVEKPIVVQPVQNPCDDCGIAIVDVPFKYSDFNFCTTRCLRAHRFAARK